MDYLNAKNMQNHKNFINKPQIQYPNKIKTKKLNEFLVKIINQELAYLYNTTGALCYLQN